MKPMPGAAVTRALQQLREHYAAADQPCPSGCPHPYRSHGPDGCRARVGKCDLCACQEVGR